jgi:hypothetical protein
MNKTLQEAMNKAINAEPVEEESIIADNTIVVEDYEVGSPIAPVTGQGVPLDSSEDIPPLPATPTPTPKIAINIKGLDEKAVLISVKRNMYSPYKLDQEESKNYGAGNVNKHLFEGRDNRVKETISKFTDVYTYVKDNTVPWTTGVDMLNINHYMEFTSGLRQRVDEAYKSVDTLCSFWDDEVKTDLDRLGEIALAKGKPNLANANDYPEVDELRSKFGIHIRYMPVPTTGDFRVGISDEDKETLQQQLDDAEVNANKHVLNSMIEPMKRALAKLSVPIGSDGSVFRDTLITNMVDVAERMDKINISDDAMMQGQIDDLNNLVTSLTLGKDVLRSNQTSREQAVTVLNGLVSQMEGLV